VPSTGAAQSCVTTEARRNTGLIGDPEHYLADGDYLNAARSFERSSRWNEAVDAYARAGQYNEAGRLLESMSRFRDAGRMLLRYLPSDPTPVRQLTALAKREAMKAALNFARGGARNEAVGLLMNLGEHTRAAGLLRMAGLREHAVLAMRGKPIPGSPWPAGILFALDAPKAPPPDPSGPAPFQPMGSPAPAPPSRRNSGRARAPSSGRQRPSTSGGRRRSSPGGRVPEPPPARRAPPTVGSTDFDDLRPALGRPSLSREMPSEEPAPRGASPGPAGPAWGAPRTFGTPGDGGRMPAGMGHAPAPRTVQDEEDLSLRPSMSMPAPGTPRVPTSSGMESVGSADPLARTPSAPPGASPTPSGAPGGPAMGGGGADIREGTILADRYRLEQLIGAGGMARVYRTMDLELEEEIALKIFLQIIYDEDEEGLKRFRQEMKLSRKLIHPNIVRIYEFGAWRGARFITMELLKGKDLEGWLDKHGGVLPPDEVLRLMIQACAGLHAAHTAGVIHRDVKPSNFFIIDEGKRLKLMDFGVAKVKGAGQSLSSVDARIGTPRYMSPEQIQGGVEVGPPADLYALGAVMYEILTGRRVFEEDDLVPLLLSHLSEPPTPLRKHAPHVPPDIEAIVMRLLQKEPSRRFPDCNELRKALLTAYVNVQRSS